MQRLDRAAYPRVLAALRAVDLNQLFARAVVEDGCPGEVHVDRPDAPSVVYVCNRYGMSLLCGDAAAPDAGALRRLLLRPRPAPEWLQVHPAAWLPRLGEALEVALSPEGAPAEPRRHASPPFAVEEHCRVNFRFRADRYRAWRRRVGAPPHPVVRVDRALFDAMDGSVVPRLFWRDAEHFLRRGIGFAVLVDGRPASLAFSSVALGDQVELGIETVDAHRGQGLAAHACAALIDHCLARGEEPVWACRLGNTGSHALAVKLGFEPVRHLPYLRLATAAA